MDETQLKKKKSLFKRWWFWVIVVLVVIIIAANSGDDGQQTAVEPNQNQSGGSVEVSKPETQEEQRTITEVGGTATTKNFIVTVESFNKLPGNQFNSPADGNEFWEVVLVVENKSNKDYTVSSMMMFDAYQDGYSVNESLSAQVANESTSTMDGGLAAGKKLRGALAYELPETWEELEIQVDLTTLSFSADGEIKIILRNE